MRNYIPITSKFDGYFQFPSPRENIFYNKEKIEITKINVERKKIKDYLPELSFTLFLRYCKKENIVYLDELDNFNLQF